MILAVPFLFPNRVGQVAQLLHGWIDGALLLSASIGGHQMRSQFCQKNCSCAELAGSLLVGRWQVDGWLDG